jgi:hypothetical protein
MAFSHHYALSESLGHKLFCSLLAEAKTHVPFP